MPGERGGGTAEERSAGVGRARLVVSGRICLSGADVSPLRPRERAVLAAIAFDHPNPVRATRIVELVWGTDAPATARKSVHNHVARLRRAVPGLVVTEDGGYRLAEGVTVDVAELASLVDAAPGPPLAQVLELLDHRLGRAFEDLAPGPEVLRRRRSVAQHALAAREAVVRRLLDDGAPSALDAARDLVERDPGSERHWWLLALALARSGRRRESLAAIAEVRADLTGRGMDLGTDLTHLERLVIAADPLVHTSAILSDPLAAAMDDELGSSSVGLVGFRSHADPWLRGEGPGALLVLGPAGSGKTTAAQELARRARSEGRGVLVAACDPEPSVPLQPLVAVLEQLSHKDPGALDVPGAAALGALSETLAERVGRAPASPEAHQLLDVVERVVARATRPVLLVIEDLHWAPPLTLEAMRRIATSAQGATRVLLTSRPELTGVADDPGIATHRMEPWTHEDIETWLRNREADEERRRAAAGWLHDQTGGLPIFVRELTLTLLDEGAIGAAAMGAFTPPVAVPPAVVAALSGRIERLSPPAQRSLEVAAVLGSQVPTPWLLATLGVTPVAVEELRSVGMLRSGPDTPDELVFEHELLRRAALERLAPAALAEIHHLALAAHEVAGLDVPPAARARHAIAAVAFDRGRAVTFADQAAGAAARAGSQREAAEWWLQAVAAEEGAACPDPERLGNLAVSAGQALLHIGDERGLEMLLGAAAEAEAREDWPVAARAAIAVCRLGPTSLAGAADDVAASLADRLLARVDDPGTRAALGAAATMVHSMAGAHERCRQLFDAAERDARVAGTDEALVAVLPFAYMSISSPEDLTRRIRLTADLAAASERLGSPGGRWSALHLRFSNQLQAGDPALRDTASELVAVTPEVGERQREWEEHYVRATIAHLDDELDVAEEIITASLGFTDTVAESRVMAVYGVHLLGIRMAQGHLDELVDAIAALATSQPEVGAWKAALALAAAYAGRESIARQAVGEVAEQPAALARDYAFSGAALALGEACVTLEDAAGAAIALELLEPLAGRWSWVGTCTLGPIDGTRAGLLRVLGRPDDAQSAAEAAVASCRAVAAPGFERAARRRVR